MPMPLLTTVTVAGQGQEGAPITFKPVQIVADLQQQAATQQQVVATTASHEVVAQAAAEQQQQQQTAEEQAVQQQQTVQVHQYAERKSSPRMLLRQMTSLGCWCSW